MEQLSDIQTSGHRMNEQQIWCEYCTEQTHVTDIYKSLMSQMSQFSILYTDVHPVVVWQGNTLFIWSGHGWL